MTAADLWTACEAAYSVQALTELTNPDSRSASESDDAKGQNAAQAVIDLWPLYAQVAYDAANDLHVQVGVMGVIAVLHRRGGSSSTIDKVTWDEVFGDDGMMMKLKRTGARARSAPVISGSTERSTEATTSGGNVRPWSDRSSRPGGLSPDRNPADDE